MVKHCGKMSVNLYLLLLALVLLLQINASAAWFFWRHWKADPPRKSYTATTPISPVIFVPGDGGSQVEAKLNKSSSPSVICAKTSNWYNLWLNLELLVLPFIYCFVDNAKLHYDNVTRTTHNTQGVDIRIPGWGDPLSVEWIDPTRNKAGAYFKNIGNMLVDKLGYERKKNLFGAPYDFRKAPNELHQFFVDFKELIEYAYERNNNTRVTLITHSMGSPLTAVFLRAQDFEWKERYIERLISLAGAWAGSVKSMKVFAMGDDLDSFFLDRKIIKAQEISTPSTAWLLPSPLFWSGTETLVETPSRNYTVLDMKAFFEDINYPIGWEMRKDTMEYTMNVSPLHVELHCLFGDDVPTVEKLHYNVDAIADEVPVQIKGPGDGTVNRRSLRACEVWEGLQSHPINQIALQNVSHLGVLADPQVLEYIQKLLMPKNITYFN